MTGELKIAQNSSGVLSLKNTTRDSTVNPETWGAFGLILFYDKNNTQTGLVENWQFDDGKIHMVMRATNRGDSAQILVGIRPDGTKYTECPPAKDNNSIVTTVSHGNNYVRFGNGVQICWGRVNVNGVITSTNVKVNFPQAFSVTPSVLSCDNANAGTNASIRVGWESTVSFTIGTRAGESSTGLANWIAIGYWY